MSVNKISYLTFQENYGKDKSGRNIAKYLCVCGDIVILNKSNVNRLNTCSCGCMRNVNMKKTHGLSSHPLYNAWINIKRRCYSEKNNSYHNYGGRGVIMCDEWLNSFDSFYNWCLLNGWEKGMEIDKDINGNGLLYSPLSCKIVTPKENSNNRRSNRLITLNLETKTLAEWCEMKNISYGVVKNRMDNLNWSIEDSLNTPVFGSYIKNQKKVIDKSSNKIYNSVQDVAIELGVSKSSIRMVCDGKRNSIFKKQYEYLK